MHGEISRRSVVERERIDGDGAYSAIVRQEVGGLIVKSWEMHFALVVGVAKLLAVNMPSPTRVHGDTRSRRNFAVFFLPRFEIVDGQLRVGVLFGFRAQVHLDNRHDQLLGENLCGAQAVFREMQRSVHVRSCVFQHLVPVEIVLVFVVVADLVEGDARRAEVSRECGGEGMGQVDDLFDAAAQQAFFTRLVFFHRKRALAQGCATCDSECRERSAECLLQKASPRSLSLSLSLFRTGFCRRRLRRLCFCLWCFCRVLAF